VLPVARLGRHVYRQYGAPQPARQHTHRMQPSYDVSHSLGAAHRALCGTLQPGCVRCSQRKIHSKSWEIKCSFTKEALDTPWRHYQTLAPTQEGEKPAPEAKNDREKGQNGHATPPGNTGTAART
jgi:hypothetical protein